MVHEPPFRVVIGRNRLDLATKKEFAALPQGSGRAATPREEAAKSVGGRPRIH